MKKTLIALAAAGALTAAVAMPASATPLADGADLPEVNGVTWTGVYGDNFRIDDAETSGYNDAWDGFGNFGWYRADTDQWSNDILCSGATVNEDTGHAGDYLLSCEPETNILGGFTSKVTGRLYAEGDMMRLEYTLTNNTDTTREISWYSQTNFGSSAIDDNATTDLTRGFDIQNAYYGYDEGFAFGLPGAPQTPDTTSVLTATDDYVEAVGPETYHSLAPGKSVTIALFYFHDMAGSTNPYPSADYANLSTWATSAFATWNERLSRGIASDVFVANWMAEAPATPAAGGGLASTGADITGALTLGGAAFAAGAIAMIVRRRRTV